MHWKTARRTLDLSRPLVMGILNVTPDSFSDGGEFPSVDDAVRRVGQMAAEGADIIDIGGESTRPGSSRVSAKDEIDRVVPVIAAVAKLDIPISVDASKAEVASAAVNAGAEIINDIAGLRWEPEIADVAAATGAGLVLMHSRGDFETMHSQPAVKDILGEVSRGIWAAADLAKQRGIRDEQLAVDIGIGFGKTFEQNLELLANLDRLVSEFAPYPMLVGASRKSFIGKVLGDAPASERLGGSLAAAVMAMQLGAAIIRVHDVKETVAAVKMFVATGGGSV